MFSSKGLLRAAAFCLVPFLLGAKGVDTEKLFYNHLTHYKTNGMSCYACHNLQESGAHSLPGHKECRECHKVEGGEADPACVVCHPAGSHESVGLLSKVARLNTENRTMHHSKKLLVLCDYCHREMLQGSVQLGELLKSREELGRVRRKAHRFPFFTNCADCHRDLSRDKAPANHKQENWKGEPHAEVAPEFNCRICHGKSFCQDCHEESY